MGKIIGNKKECPVCRETKTLDKFTKSRQLTSGVFSYCLDCCLKRSMKNYRKRKGDPKTPEEKANMPCRLCNRSLPFDRFLRSTNNLSGRLSICRDCLRARAYKTTWQTIVSIREDQQGQCPCCECDLPFEKEFVDHCHKTGIVRGLLCLQCNSALGMAKDNTKTLKKMIKYIKKHEKEVAKWRGL